MTTEVIQIDVVHQSVPAAGTARFARPIAGGNRTTALLISACVGLVAIAAFAVGSRVWHMQAIERQLQAMNATYAWDCETFDRVEETEPSERQQTLARWFGRAAVSDFSIVRLVDENLDDSTLSILGRLRKLRSLELRSNAATDSTLTMIGQLPDLRYLSVAGNQFTIMGLLQLRNAPSLRSVRIDTRRLSPIELAVLKHELAGVHLKSWDSLHGEYDSGAPIFKPAA